jgi:HlyD family secretion protein
MKLKRVLLWVLALAVIGGLAWGGVTLVRRRNSKTESTTSTSYIATAERGDLVASITPTGEVYAPRQAELTVDVTRLPLVELIVVAGDKVTQGEVLARIDRASLERAVDQAKANLLSAEDALATAKNPYTQLDQQQAAVTVAQAKTSLEEARSSLADLQDPDVDAAKQSVEDATRDLKQAQDDLAALKKDTSAQDQIDRLQWLYNEALVTHGDLVAKNDASEVGQDRLLVAYNKMLDAKDSLEAAKVQAELSMLSAENKVAEAQDTLSDAKEKLATAQSGPTALELAQADDKVAQAQYNLTKAQENQATIAAGPDENKIQTVQASYDAATAALAQAEATLTAATVVAPFDGTVISVGAEVGDLVSAGTVIVTMADLTELRVRATVDETEISQVKVGQDVQITFDAFTGYTFKGKVLEVPLQGTLSQNVVTYDVPISLEGTDDVALKSGMTANLTIVTGESKSALLIPALAVQQGDTGDVVMVQDASGEAVQTPVEIGLGNGTYVEVLRGLNEGDQVVVQYDTSTQNTNFGFGRDFGPPEGGTAPSGGGAPPSGGGLP